ncbi:MAG: hypothetical protein NDJ94_19775 [Vicinamibacteria bacterium]|nr:hypothetical protein [Vicinamibacteria bacterium]
MVSLWVGLLAAAVGAASQDMTASLVVTNQPGTLFMRWQEGRDLQISNVKRARRGEPLAAIVLFSGCAADPSGRCNVTMDMTVFDPHGGKYGEASDTEVWVGKPAPKPGASQLSVGYMKIRIEPKDPPGSYKIKATVADRVSGRSVVTQWAFEVPEPSAADTGRWPADQPKPNLVGFWKDHCEDEFGLKIETAGENLYSISFCGPGGCFEPGTYRPNSAIFDDEAYRVLDANTIEVLGGDGFSKYLRCDQSK